MKHLRARATKMAYALRLAALFFLLPQLGSAARQEVTEIAAHIVAEAHSGTPLGGQCEGKLLKKQGSCDSGMRCYDACEGQVTAKMCDGSIARSGQGECYYPTGHQCDKDSMCRGGTLCAADLGICVSCPNDLTQPAYCVEHAIADALDRWRARYIKGGGSPGAKAANRVFKERGVQSVSRARDHTVELLGVMGTAGLKPIGKGASRSGASFFMTMDENMLVKGFSNKQEYEELIAFKKNFKAAAAGTTFIIPKLSFTAFDNTYWVVMGNTHIINMGAVGTEYKNRETFDVKPEPLISAKREALLQRLVEIDFRPEGTALQTLFWQAVNHDVKYLDDHGLCDWSWLVDIYEMHEDFRLPEDVPEIPLAEGGRAWCFHANAAQSSGANYVVCFSLIDFSLSLVTLPAVKKLENKIMADKWTNYGDKFHTFTHCIFNPDMPADTMRELGWTEVLSSGMAEVEGKKVFRVKVPFHLKDFEHRGIGNAMAHTKCYQYRKKACSEVVKSVNPYPSSKTCDFTLKDAPNKSPEKLEQEAQYCLPYMAEVCQAWVFDNARSDVVADHAAKFIFRRM